MTEKQMEKALDNHLFYGFCGNNPFLKYNWSTFQDWCAGLIIISIGAGTIRDDISGILKYSAAWHQYQKAK
jgi:hypothetical protein